MPPGASRMIVGSIVVGTLVCCLRLPATASEAGQGMFDVLLDNHPVHCSAGVPIVTGYTSTFSFDDKTFLVNLPPGNNNLEINFSVLGTFTSIGVLDCIFDEGGSFEATAANEAGDFEWTEIKGESVDRKPGVGEGDPYPFVGSARCATTRTDAFKTLCDSFTFSFNGLGKIGPETFPNVFHYSAGDFTLRAVKRVPVPGPQPQVDVQAMVDGPGGSIPEIQVRFRNGVEAAGQLSVTTLAEVRGVLPPGLEFPVQGTTEIDHGAGPVPFFPGGDERFVDIRTDAVLPARADIEVCLPLPAAADPADVRPVRVLHGEETTAGERRFVDRTFRTDRTSGQVCARVGSFSKFALGTTDVCGRGQLPVDGLLTVAGGLIGKRTAVVAGLTDCTQYPANLPRGVRRYCVPDTDPSTDYCTVAVTLGVNRGACNRVTAAGLHTHSSYVDVGSYRGTLSQGRNATSLASVFGTQIAALVNPIEATVGPVDLVLPVTKRVTTYKIKQELTGVRPGTTNDLRTDKDVLKIRCIDPTQF